jgi:hypothetical protein
MKYTLLFFLPLVLLMPIAQTVSAETSIMDKLTKAFQMLTSGDEQTIGNMTEMTDNKTNIDNQTLDSLGSKLTKAFQMLTSGDEQTIGNMTEMTDNKTSQLKSLIAELKFRSGLDTFVNFEPQGYGIYQQKESSVFKPGEELILYIEPKGYEYGTLLDESGDKLYTIDFAVDFAISDESGNILTSQQGITLDEIVSHHKNKELFIPFTITQSSPFPDGNYIITYVIHDKISGASFDILKNITIAS